MTIEWVEKITTVPVIPHEPEFDPKSWAAACRDAFAARQPHLVDQVWDDIWEAVPYSYRLWVVSLKRTDRFGTIIVPDQAKTVRYEGWVVSVGNRIHEPDPAMNQRSPYEHPLDLVGRRVFWGAYCGVDLDPSEIPANDAPPRNKPYPHQYRALSIADVLGESLKVGGSIL